MNRKTYGRSAILAGLLGLICTLSTAQTNATGTQKAESDVGATSGDSQFFVGQRFWFATWGNSLVDAQIVLPNPLSPVPVLQQSVKPATSGMTIMPVTAIGYRHKNWIVSATFTPQTKFTSEGLAVGDAVSRDEADLNLGYAIFPNLVASIVYKTAKVDQGSTASGTRLTGIGGGYKIDGLLLGLSASAQISGPLAMYGNFAFGPARETVYATGLTDVSYNGNYLISEIGLAYRLTDERAFLGLKNFTMQFGYRSQNVTLNELQFGTYSIGPTPVLISTERKNIQANTQGFVFGLVASF